MHDPEDRARAEQAIRELTSQADCDEQAVQALVDRIADAWRLFDADWQRLTPQLPKTLLCLSGALQERINSQLASLRHAHALKVHLGQRPGRFRLPDGVKAARGVAELVQRRMWP